MRTRHTRVGWLGIGVISIACTAASAGPSFVRFDESEPIASTPIEKTSDSPVVLVAANFDAAESPSFAELEALPAVWHAVPELQLVVAKGETSSTAAVEYRALPLSVPLQFGWLGVLAFTTIGSYLGARWVGIRRNHGR